MKPKMLGFPSVSAMIAGWVFKTAVLGGGGARHPKLDAIAGVPCDDADIRMLADVEDLVRPQVRVKRLRMTSMAGDTLAPEQLPASLGRRA